MAAKIRTQLIAGVRRKLAEATARIHTDDDITDSLGEALIEIWALARELDEGWAWGYTTAQDIVAGIAAYTIEAGVFGPFRVEFKDDNGAWIPLGKMALRAYSQSTRTSDRAWPPNRYVPTATEIIVQPIPSTAHAGSLRILAKLDATKFITAATTSGLPQDADEAIELGAAYRRLRDEGSASWQGFKLLADQKIESLIATLTNRTPWVREIGFLGDNGELVDTADDPSFLDD